MVLELRRGVGELRAGVVLQHRTEALGALVGELGALPVPIRGCPADTAGGGDGEKPVNPLGMVDSRPHHDGAAQREAAEVRPIDLEGVEEGDQVSAELRQAAIRRPRRGLAVPAQVVCDDPVVKGQPGQHFAPGPMIIGQAV